MRIDSHNINAKIRSWSKKQEKEVKKSEKVSSSGDKNSESCNRKSSGSHRSEKNIKRLERTFNEPQKIEQNLDCINCEDLTKIRGIRRASIKSWEELKREMREIFVPLYYKRYLFIKLQKYIKVLEVWKSISKRWKLLSLELKLLSLTKP
ncbi:hypothetical protein CR513_45367, partial [Mucuna pruriens]